MNISWWHKLRSSWNKFNNTQYIRRSSQCAEIHRQKRKSCFIDRTQQSLRWLQLKQRRSRLTPQTSAGLHIFFHFNGQKVLRWHKQQPHANIAHHLKLSRWTCYLFIFDPPVHIFGERPEWIPHCVHQILNQRCALRAESVFLPFVACGDANKIIRIRKCTECGLGDTYL